MKFLDDYMIWKEEKERHQSINQNLKDIHHKEIKEPLENQILDVLFSYFEKHKDDDIDIHSKNETYEWKMKQGGKRNGR